MAIHKLQSNFVHKFLLTQFVIPFLRYCDGISSTNHPYKIRGSNWVWSFSVWYIWISTWAIVENMIVAESPSWPYVGLESKWSIMGSPRVFTLSSYITNIYSMSYYVMLSMSHNSANLSVKIDHKWRNLHHPDWLRLDSFRLNTAPSKYYSMMSFLCKTAWQWIGRIADFLQTIHPAILLSTFLYQAW